MFYTGENVVCVGIAMREITTHRSSPEDDRVEVLVVKMMGGGDCYRAKGPDWVTTVYPDCPTEALLAIVADRLEQDGCDAFQAGALFYVRQALGLLV